MTDREGGWEYYGCGPSCCRCHCDCEDAVEWRTGWQAQMAAITTEEWAEINERVKQQRAELGWD